MKMRIEGLVHRLGHDIDIEQIYPGKYLALTDTSRMAQHLFEGYDPELASKLSRGDVIVAGRNFGQGVCREQAAKSLANADIACVIASSFSRAFYRSAVSQGLLPIECREAHEKIADGEKITIDLEKSQITCRKGLLRFEKLPDEIAKIVMAGGLIPYVKKYLGK